MILSLRMRVGVISFLRLENFVQCSLRLSFPFQLNRRTLFLLSTLFFWTQPVFTGIFRYLPRYMPPVAVRRIDSLPGIF